METETLAQTHMRGPLAVNGSGKPLTKEELEGVKEELEAIKAEFGLKEPTRSFMDDPDTKWRFGGPPDYSLTNLYYLKQRTKEHPEDSLEKVVENIVKTYEMESNHKLDHTAHKSVDQKKFNISANGGKAYGNKEANEVGSYNILLDACPADTWDTANATWGQSHEKFNKAFAAFPWEVLEVYSGPPKVSFSWHHWANFTGTYEGNKGKGELVELFGFATATVNENLQLCDVEIYYNAEDFISVLRGKKTVEDVNLHFNARAACPFAKQVAANKKKGGSASVREQNCSLM